MEKKVEIYTKFTCIFCVRAKRLLESKNVQYIEYDITMNAEKRQEMVDRAPGARTVPQIFIGGLAIGGSDDLAALESSGNLDDLLAAV